MVGEGLVCPLLGVLLGSKSTALLQPFAARERKINKGNQKCFSH